MKKPFFLILAFPFFITQTAFAESSANVKINNNVSGSSTSNATSQTNITVETNGKTTTYFSDKPENIEIKSVNGVSEIKVNGQVVSQSPTQTSATKTPTPKDEPEDEDDKEKAEEKARGIFDQIEDLLKSLFLLLS